MIYSSAQRLIRPAITFLTAVVALLGVGALWEGYKWMGQQTDDKWPLIGFGLPVKTNDLTMPHIRDMWDILFEPVQRGRDQTLAGFIFESATFTMKSAALGLLIGLAVGFALALIMLRFRMVERAMLPWINISQTVPLIALAPIVATWGRSNGLSDTVAVSLIAAYLTFFPVAINGLKGLQSPNSAHVELMRSYASSWTATLTRLRIPAARPYLFSALKLAATLSVVGAIVGEISIGQSGGLGRVIYNFASRYSTGPARLYSAVFGAALLGLAAFGLVSMVEAWAQRHERKTTL